MTPQVVVNKYWPCIGGWLYLVMWHAVRSDDSIFPCIYRGF